MNNNITIFDINRKIKQLNNIAKHYQSHNFIHKEFARRLANQFEGIIVKKFEKCLNLYSRDSYLTELLLKNANIGKIDEADFTFCLSPDKKSVSNRVEVNSQEIINAENNNYDLVVSNLAMHWVNDLPGHLIQIRKLLKKDGFFTANLIGGNSLVELRNALAEAESEISSSISPRISPMIDLRDGAALIQRTGFREPVSTSEEITVKYSSFYDLLRDIKFSGEGSSLIKQNKNIPPRELFKKAENIYKQKFSDEEGNLNATIEVITISGWKI